MLSTYRNFGWIMSAALLIVISFTLSTRAARAAELFYSNSFESGWADMDFMPCSDMHPWTFNIDNSIARSGSSSARVENRNANNNNICSRQQDGKHRAQLQMRGAPELAVLNTPTWIGFSVFVPNNHPTNQPGGYIMAQLIGGGYGPEFQVLMNKDGNSWRIVKTWADGSTDKKNSTLARSVAVTKGEWQDWVIYRERSWQNNGVLRVWVNGEQVVNDTGPNAINYRAYNNGGVIEFNPGIYWGVDQRPGAIFAIYFDDVRLATGPDGYDLVASAGGSASGTAVRTPTVPTVPTGLSLSVQ